MKSILFLFLFLFFNNNAFSQTSAIAEYGVVFSTPLCDDKLKLEDPQFYEHQLAKQNSADQLNFVLKLQERKSVFYRPSLSKPSDAVKFAKSNTGGYHLIYNGLVD